MRSLAVGSSVSLLFALGCSEPPPSAPPVDADAGTDAPPDAGPKPEWASGTRLRAVVTTDGVIERFAGFHDSVLDLDCAFRPAADGKVRCEPIVFGAFAYLDAACTQRVFTQSTTCNAGPPPKWASYDDPACGARHVIALDAPTNVTSLYQKSGTSCVAAPTGGVVVQPIARELAPTELVAATVDRAPRTEKLVVSYWDAEDGARGVRAVEGRGARAGTCVGDYLSDHVVRCVPAHAATANGIFADATCSTALGSLAAFNGDECTLPPVAVRRVESDACGVHSRYFEVGATVSGPLYESTSSCGPAAPSPLVRSNHVIGAPIADDSFAPLDYAHDERSPLALGYTVTTGDVRLGGGNFWSSALQKRCEPGLAADDTTRCIPDAGNAAYADAACTVPILPVEQRPGCGVPVPTLARELLEPTATCRNRRARILKVGAKLASAPSYWTKSGASCVAVSASSTDLYATTDEVPATELVPLSRIVK